MTSSLSASRSRRGMSTAGSTPLAPAVGAATMRRIQALHSPVFSAAAMILRRKGGHRPGPVPSSRAPSPPLRPLGERRAGS